MTEMTEMCDVDRYVLRIIKRLEARATLSAVADEFVAKYARANASNDEILEMRAGPCRRAVRRLLERRCIAYRHPLEKETKLSITLEGEIEAGAV